MSILFLFFIEFFIVEEVASQSSSDLSSMKKKGVGGSSTSSGSINGTPYEITIVSNDVAFFTDVNITSHKRAVARLWDKLRPKFQSNYIRSVKIVIFETKVAALELPGNHSIMTNNHLGRNSSVSLNTCETSDNHSKEGNIENNDGGDSTIGFDQTPHRFKVAFCVREIQNYIVKLSEKEYNKLDGKNESRKGMPLNFQFELKDFHPILFSSILQQWSKHILHSAASDFGSICFELPETFDGTQSAVALDLSYSILPYRLDSPITNSLIDDLKLLSESCVEVMQLVPLDSIDLSLIYGTPLTAKAGMGSDLNQYKHMQVLVRALFNYLGSHDVALVLKSSNTESRLLSSSSRESETQLFLLMAHVCDKEKKEGGESSKDSPTCSQYKATGHGMLYRYIDRAEHIVEEPINTDFNGDESEEDELTLFSEEYIGMSLGMLDCFHLNPYTIQGSNTNQTTSCFNNET